MGRPVGGTLSITFDDGFRDNFEVAAPILRRHRLPATFFVTASYIGSVRSAPWEGEGAAAERWMTWDQLRTLQSQGFEIGAHTLNHGDLARATHDLAGREIAGSRTILEEGLGVPVDHFAYPFGGPGNVTGEVRDLVREAGFRSCSSCHGGVNRDDADPFHLRRIPITGWYPSPYHLGMSLALGRA